MQGVHLITWAVLIGTATGVASQCPLACQNGGSCLMDTTDVYRCECAKGYFGNYCARHLCTEMSSVFGGMNVCGLFEPTAQCNGDIPDGRLCKCVNNHGPFCGFVGTGRNRSLCERQFELYNNLISLMNSSDMTNPNIVRIRNSLYKTGKITALKTLLVDVGLSYLPQRECMSSGTFRPIQCEVSSVNLQERQCFCADKNNGRLLAGYSKMSTRPSNCPQEQGKCACDSDNWSGQLCDTCSDTFYGPNCLPFINVLHVIPDTGPETGGSVVHVSGHNFPETQNNVFYCRFDRDVVNATRVSKEHITCTTPQHPAAVVDLEVSADGNTFTRNKTKFTFYEKCPPGACGKTQNPPRGHCLFGGCICTLPWSGDDCSIQLNAPVISPVQSDQTSTEGEEYQLQPVLTEGSVPITWNLHGAPKGMTINQRTGKVFWERTVARKDPYLITITASNRIGRYDVTWVLRVALSYDVTIDEVLPGGIQPVPKAMQIKGHVTYISAANRRMIAFVDVKIRNKARVTTVPVVTTPNNPTQFEAVYFPKADDSGKFEVGGHHPSDGTFASQKTWSVLGMKCVPGYVNKQAYLDTDHVEMRGVTLLKNTGVNTIADISATVEGLGGPLSAVVVRAEGVLSSDSSKPLIASLEKDGQVSIDIILTASRPLRGTIAVVFRTADGTTARMRLGLQLNIRRPVLIPSPSSIRYDIAKGTQKSFQFAITNEGDVPATGLNLTLPTEPRLSISSFSTSNQQASANGLNLQPNETAILVLTVTSGSTDSLGEFSGSIALNSDLSSARISYRFYVTSLSTLNITVRVEDEYTYFASDKPLVSGAVVTLRNPRKRYNEQRLTTNETDFVVFEDVHEDRYTLTATAPGHGSYSAVVLAKTSESSFTIFLQRVAVKYTWTVTPTTFQDKYIVTLDSTFETQVPMPVVTVEPANINLIPYEEGRNDVINFNITNHGLIRADNARFVMPGNHPTLMFTQTIDPIGAVDANTSIIVPVLVSVRKRVKRNLVTAVCGLKMLYNYYCGGTKTGGQDITLTSVYPGRPPLPCGIGGGGIGGGESGSGGGGSAGGSVGGGRYGVGGGYVGISGTGGASSSPSSSVVVYNPVTPLSCDCAGTLINTCVLGFHPIAGCAIATTGLSGASGFWGYAKATLDFAAACVLTPLSPVCPWCGLGATLWQAAGCVYEMDRDCSSRRRRRSTSAVIQGVVNSNVAMRNYLIMLKELFGGEEMFDVYDNSWVTSFNLALSEDSFSGSFLSRAEVASIVSPLNSSLVVPVERFLLRWNKTMTALEDGSLSSLGPNDGVMSYNVIMNRFKQFKTDTGTAKQRGMDSIFDDFDNAVNVYKENDKMKANDDGVCAKVRVRIVQELVLTRDAFNARLELENGELSALENIRVSVNIKSTYGDGSLATDLFSIGKASLVGITGVDGMGRLDKDMSGTAEWLIIPYSTAAVKEDTLYDIGGTLSYVVDGSNFSIPLLPDTITVKPNPSLIVNYFQEKYVQGDDPMTADVAEPIVPFTLAVMVSNGAYGVARQLKITSAQPEIIENEKGLLVAFKIVGAQLGNEPVTPSLSIDFGDIGSFETKIARWLLTSSLKGMFYNYTATFENINPLGDPQLSIMEHVGYHELVHLVRLETPKDDLDDFLVNDIIDEDEMPDAVYDSANGLYSTPVVVTEVTRIALNRSLTRGTKTYLYVSMTVNVFSTIGTTYGYTRLENNITKDTLSQSLLQVINFDGKGILLEKNAWQTSYYHDVFYLHLFDFYDLSNYSKPLTYSLIYGPRNLYVPAFDREGYSADVPPTVVLITVMTVSATDKDKESQLVYTLDSTMNFTINPNSGEIRNKVPLEVDTFVLIVTVADDGIPVLSNSVRVEIHVKNGVILTSPGSSSSTSTDGSTLVSTSTVSSTLTNVSESGSSSTEVTTSTGSGTTVQTSGVRKEHSEFAIVTMLLVAAVSLAGV